MRTIIGLVVLAVLGFYVAWPGYSAYRIKTALDTDNAELLAAKVDFEQVRASLKPAVTAEVEKAMTAAVQQGGAANEALLQQLKGQVMPKVVDSALTAIVTPESILRFHRERDYKATLAKIIAEKMGAGSLGALTGAAGGGAAGGARIGDVIGGIGKATGIDPGKMLGGLFGKKEPAAETSPPAGTAKAAGGDSGEAAKPKFSLANIKSFSMSGPLGFAVGVAKDPAATLPDLTADLAFTGSDWKLVGLRPRV